MAITRLLMQRAGCGQHVFFKRTWSRCVGISLCDDSLSDCTRHALPLHEMLAEQVAARRSCCKIVLWSCALSGLFSGVQGDVVGVLNMSELLYPPTSLRSAYPGDVRVCEETNVYNVSSRCAMLGFRCCSRHCSLGMLAGRAQAT